MTIKRIVALLMIGTVLFIVFCGCDNQFEDIRKQREINNFSKQEEKISVSDIQVLNTKIDYLQASSYSSFLHVVGIAKNNSNQEANCITLTIYLYQNDSVVLTEREYVYDLGPGDENSFDFLIDEVKLLTCDEYVVKVTDVF